MLWNYLKKAMDANPNKRLIEGETELTFRCCLSNVAAFASQLIPGEKYGVLCHSELNGAQGVLSCLACGAIAVPLSYRYGERHYRKIIETMGIARLISDESGSIKIVELNTSAVNNYCCDGTVMLLCTSGTTGVPKGAMISGQNLLSNLQDIERYFHVSREDCILIIRPLYHCAVMTGEFLIALVKGMDICFEEGQFNPIKILKLIREKQITVMGGTPTLFYHICNVLKRETQPLPLKTIMLSGECMTQAAADTLIACFSGVQKYNVYGLTEASPRVAYLPPDKFEQYPLSVGRPLDSITARVINEAGDSLPIGTIGELVVQGPNIMQGYYNNPMATQTTVQNGWLHTGDLAWLDANGYIYIKSRKDDLIIRGGMNIYPAEIENAVKQEPGIAEALAYPINDGAVSQRIGLRVVPAEDSLTKAQVFALCKACLPIYQLPDVIELVEALPRNASGKVVRR